MSSKVKHILSYAFLTFGLMKILDVYIVDRATILFMTPCTNRSNLRPFSLQSEHFENLAPCVRILKSLLTFNVFPLISQKPNIV